ncbi:hypothetical protein [Dyella sp.]|uniref:hypothetical protein n=1 Tax=Dyella sp. TaxID=1869338 RepID=UPI003F7DD1A0
MDSRQTLVHALLSLVRPVPEVARELSTYGLDSPSPLAVLDEAHVSSVLKRFLAGELSSAQVEEWADCIECRDDIEYDPDSAGGLALHELANPLLTRPLTRDSATALLATLAADTTLIPVGAPAHSIGSSVEQGEFLMGFMRPTGIAFASALVGTFLAMAAAHWLGLAPLHVWVAVCIAAGSALGFGIKTYWQLSRGMGFAVVGALVGVGSMVGHWLTMHA